MQEVGTCCCCICWLTICHNVNVLQKNLDTFCIATSHWQSQWILCRAAGDWDTISCHGLQSLSADRDQSRMKNNDKLSLQAVCLIHCHSMINACINLEIEMQPWRQIVNADLHQRVMYRLSKRPGESTKHVPKILRVRHVVCNKWKVCTIKPVLASVKQKCFYVGLCYYTVYKDYQNCKSHRPTKACIELLQQMVDCGRYVA